MGTMVAVYLLSTSRSNLNWVALSRLGSQLRQPVLLAISTGAIAALLVYFSFSIWSATENHWLASGFILQSAATLAVLSLLIWQTLAKLTGRDQVNLAPTLLQLTEENHLKRLIAVRQLEQWLQQRRLDLAEQTNVAACLEYLLHYEQDELIREAAFAALQLTRSPGDREKTTLTAGSGIPMSKMSQNPQVVRVRPEAVPSQNEIQRSQTQTESSPQQA